PIKIKSLTQTIQKAERKRFDEKFDTDTMSKQAFIAVKVEVKSFLDQAIQRTVEKTANKIMFYWKQAMVYSEDTKSCLDRKIMLNHFNEIKELFTHPTKEDK
ncbi:MAG: hypothetical protein AAB922_04495, partial [Patescibacteria group bacterium]